MKIAYIGTYPPRQCGIGTFTENLCKSIALNVRQNTKTHASVIAINDSSSLQEYDYPPEVKFVVRQNYREDYINAAEQINLSNSRACILNHEFGIFGGESGLYILSLTDRLKIPLTVVFHTVLKEPSFLQKNIIRKINETAAKIVVMSNKAVELLIGIYDIPPHKIEVIEHGVPDYQDVSHDAIKKEYNLSDRNVLLTFGFLGRNKGIETVIDALPAVVQKHPSLLYIVLGATHPNILKYSGEEYRNYLNKLVRDRKLQDNVIFLKSFVTEDVLFEYLRACDIYITPYNNKEQITSGTLAYAVGAGAAVLSTPYWHAEELLADGRGRLFDFKKPEQLSDILNELLDHPEKMNALREKAYNYGIQLRWPTIGKRYLKLLNAVKDTPLVAKKPRKSFIEVELLPEFTLDHVKRLTDDTGIVQHARYGIPNLKEGYCLDDNARALLMSLMAYGQNKDPFALDCMRIYLSYIQYMQTEQGTFRNFLSFRRDFLDKEGSEDSFGRTIWALGYLLYASPNIAYREFGKE
ncbi:MAG TPA: glycosyl transferase, partial [Porphyromonadaceae bacterium]|nr:glycosyl transferase [Porphyromonadaceae bacterium]